LWSAASIWRRRRQTISPRCWLSSRRWTSSTSSQCIAAARTSSTSPRRRCRAPWCCAPPAASSPSQPSVRPAVSPRPRASLYRTSELAFGNVVVGWIFLGRRRLVGRHAAQPSDQRRLLALAPHRVDLGAGEDLQDGHHRWIALGRGAQRIGVGGFLGGERRL